MFVTVTGTFLNTLKFMVKDCDPNTGEPDDDVGFADEYVVSINSSISVPGGRAWIAEKHSVLISTCMANGSVQFFYFAIIMVGINRKSLEIVCK